MIITKEKIIKFAKWLGKLIEEIKEIWEIIVGIKIAIKLLKKGKKLFEWLKAINDFLKDPTLRITPFGVGR